MNETRLVKTIRLDNDKVAKILERLDSAHGAVPTERRAPRYRYRVPSMIVHMAQPGSSEAVPYLVPTRNVSSTGMSFLHGGFVHMGTKILAQMTTTKGSWNRVVGTVVRCRLVEGTIHEVGVHFVNDLDPSAYSWEAFQGRYLLAERDEAASRTITFHLEQLGGEVIHAETGAEVLEKSREREFHLALVAAELSETNGAPVATELRQRGFRDAIVIATTSRNPADHKAMLATGADRVLVKPYARNAIQALVALARDVRERAATATPTG